MVLVFINPLNKNYKGELIYEFLFAETDEINCGDDWDVEPASSGKITLPNLNEISCVGILTTTDIEFELAMFSDNFSMYDCAENIIALGWEKDSPENERRLAFQFGEDIDSVKSKLYSRDKIMEIKNI